MKKGISYFARTRLEHYKEDMAEIKRNGCNFVVHTFSESDLEFAKGSIEKLVKLSHDEGLEVWLDPWAVGGVFGGESYSQFASLNLDSRQISAKGESLPAACFNSDKFKAYIREWVDSAVEIGADNIFWDEPHFYIYKENIDEEEGTELWSCRCNSCQKKFKAKYGYELPLKINKDVQDFKERSIAAFITDMASYVKGKGKENSFCFLPRYEHIGGVRNWETFAGIGDLDIIGTDPYWPTDIEITKDDVIKKVSFFSRKIKELCDKYNKIGQIWILNFKIKSGTEDYIRVAVDTAYKEGIRNIAAWSYYGTEMMAKLSSDDPALVWKTLGKSYQKLR
jgi:hypothetical protein